jgi:cytochrome c oxidase subunit 2
MLEGMQGVSSFASSMDTAILVVFGISTAVFLLVIGVMFYFLYKYSNTRSSKKDIKNIEHNTPLEIAWTVLPMFLLAVMFYYGFTSLKAIRTIPDQNMEVKVIARMWYWTHVYPNGKKTKDLYVPIGQNIKLNITAPKNDVLHSYYVPAFRFKQDAVPGFTYNAWFNATQKGVFDIECTEYCGVGHSSMLGKIYVISQEDFDKWYNSDRQTPFDKVQKVPTHPGLVALNTNGCTGCHTLDGSPLVGPSYKGMWGRKVKVNEGGTLKEVVTDEAYLKESILNPDAQVVDGFSAGMMTSYKGVLSDKDIDNIIDYFKNGNKKAKVSVKDQALNVLNSNGCTGCHSLDGSPLIGPSYKGMWARHEKVSTNGTSRNIVVDEKYLKDAILTPDSDVVEGFSAGMMTSYKGVLSDKDIDIVIEYFKGL